MKYVVKWKEKSVYQKLDFFVIARLQIFRLWNKKCVERIILSGWMLENITNIQGSKRMLWCQMKIKKKMFKALCILFL